jgi:ribosomal protein S18 acetylase RimI-like enzyme
MHDFIDASLSDIPVIRDIAEKTWWPTYSSILSSDQIRYMLDVIYSPETLQRVMSDGSQAFMLMRNDKTPVGFVAFGPREKEPSVYKVHKLYVLPENHGRGYGKSLIDEVKRRLKTKDIKILDLNVARANPAKTFYEKIGFSILMEEDIQLGPYLLQDYIMRIQL